MSGEGRRRASRKAEENMTLLYNRNRREWRDGIYVFAVCAALLVCNHAYAQTQSATSQCGGNSSTSTTSQSQGGCSAVANKQFTDLAAIECPGGPCQSGTTGPITKCVLAGNDPPIQLRPDCGKGTTFNGMGSQSFAGKCPPTTNGTISCQSYATAGAANVSGTPVTNNNLSMPNISMPSLGGLIPTSSSG